MKIVVSEGQREVPLLRGRYAKKDTLGSRQGAKQNAPASLEFGTFVEAALPRSLLED